MSTTTRVIAAPHRLERGSGKDVFFGMQTTTQYQGASCAAGDRTLSCTDITKQVCSTYTRVFGCCDPADGGACGISVGCQHCDQVKTGQTCQCEHVETPTPTLDVQKIQSLLGQPATAPSEFPVGAAGSTVQPSPSSTLKGVVIVGALVLVGFLGFSLLRRGQQ